MSASFLGDIDALCERLDRELAATRPHAEEILARYAEVDAKLVAAGFPRTSPWWRQTIERWYRSGKRQLTARVGRRGGKSSSLSRLGVVEALYGKHVVPPGDTGVVAIISTRREEAAERIGTVKAILDVLGVRYRPWGEYGVKLVGRRVGFRVYTASIAGVSGFTGIFVICDEVSKWKDSETGVNPATEVLASVRPTMATQREARIVLSSSPMGMLDAHYDAFEEGETALQITAYAPTWVANPSVTEADCEVLEPDPVKRAREYEAIPQAANDHSLISEALIERARRHPPMCWDEPPRPGHYYVATMDPATRRHAWTLVVATRGLDGVRRVVLAREWRPSPGVPLRPKSVLAEVQALIAPYGLRTVWTDQAAIDHLRDLMPEGMTLLELVWTQAEITKACEHLLKLAQAEVLELHPDPTVKSDLLGILEVFTRNGRSIVFQETKDRHSDYAPAIAMAVDDARWAAREQPAPSQESAHKTALREKLRSQRREQERIRGRVPVTHQRIGLVR